MNDTPKHDDAFRDDAPSQQPGDEQQPTTVPGEAGAESPADTGVGQTAPLAAAPPAPAEQAPNERARGRFGSGRGPRNWVVAGVLAALLSIGIGSAGYALGSNDSGERGQTSGRSRDGNDGRGNRDRGDGGTGEDPLTGTALDRVTVELDGGLGSTGTQTRG